MNNIGLLIQLSGLTQETVSKKLDVTPATVSFWKDGKKEPKISKLISLSELFGVTVGCVVGTEPIPAGYPNHQRPASGSASFSTSTLELQTSTPELQTSTSELQTSTPASTDFQSRIPAARTGAPSLLQNEKEQPEPSQTAPADPSAAPAPFSADQLAFLDNRLDQQGQLLDQRLDQFKYDLLEAIREDISSLSEKKHG